MDRSAPRYAARLRRIGPYRRLPAAMQVWALRLMPPRPRRHGGRNAPSAPLRSQRWLRLLAGVVVMAALFTVLLSAAEPGGMAVVLDGPPSAGPAGMR